MTVIFHCRLPRTNNVPRGTQLLLLARRLHRIRLRRFRPMTFRNVNGRNETLLLPRQQRLYHVTRRRRTTSLTKVSGLRRIIRRSTHTRRKAKRSLVKGRQNLVRCVWDIDYRVVIREGVTRLVKRELLSVGFFVGYGHQVPHVHQRGFYHPSNQYRRCQLLLRLVRHPRRNASRQYFAHPHVAAGRGGRLTAK